MDKSLALTAKDLAIVALLLVIGFMLWSNHTPSSATPYQKSTPSSNYTPKSSYTPYHKSYTDGYSTGSSDSKPATCYDGNFDNDNGQC